VTAPDEIKVGIDLGLPEGSMVIMSAPECATCRAQAAERGVPYTEMYFTNHPRRFGIIQVNGTSS
jgi:hypothetical protein